VVKPLVVVAVLVFWVKDLTARRAFGVDLAPVVVVVVLAALRALPVLRGLIRVQADYTAAVVVVGQAEAV
jgi:hypothetical protein